MLSGVLIGESLRTGAELTGIPLQVAKLWRAEAGDTSAGQPTHWTLLEFTAEDTDAERLAEALAQCLSPTGGWYVDYRTDDQAYVVFANRVFRYPRGDTEGRGRAQEYGRSVGVPEAQLDWGE
jgi:hypothetical protein